MAKALSESWGCSLLGQRDHVYVIQLQQLCAQREGGGGEGTPGMALGGMVAVESEALLRQGDQDLWLDHPWCSQKAKPEK